MIIELVNRSDLRDVMKEGTEQKPDGNTRSSVGFDMDLDYSEFKFVMIRYLLRGEDNKENFF